MARVSALRERRGGVLVELDGEPWRTLPVDVVARALLCVGEELDRPRLRELRRELRRSEALSTATRALRHRDLSAHDVEARLERAGVGSRERERTLETLERAGYVDDARFADRRAQALAGRAWGDAAILADLERHGVGQEERAAAVAALEPERDRAALVVAARGPGRRTAAYLARRGFDADAVEHAAGPIAEDA